MWGILICSHCVKSLVCVHAFVMTFYINLKGLLKWRGGVCEGPHMKWAVSSKTFVCMWDNVCVREWRGERSWHACYMCESMCWKDQNLISFILADIDPCMPNMHRSASKLILSIGSGHLYLQYIHLEDAVQSDIHFSPRYTHHLQFGAQHLAQGHFDRKSQGTK